MTTRFAQWMTGVLAAGYLAGIAPAAERGVRESSRDRYQVLSDYNVFVRDRRGPVRERPAPVTRPAPRPIEMSHILLGIVLEDGEYRAYVENTDARSVLRLRESDAVARGKVAVIDIDAIAYESDGQFTWVTVGSNLMGERSAPPAPPVPAVAAGGSGGSTTRPSVPLPGADNPNLTLEERLKLRRAQELNRP